MEYPIEEIDPDHPDWLDFIGRKANANIFHHPLWSRLMKECYGYRPFVLGLRSSDGTIAAGLPVLEVKRFGHPRWISLPFSDHCAPLSSSPEATCDFVKCLEILSRQSGCPPLEIRWELPRHEPGKPQGNYLLHTLCLEADLDKVRQGIHHTHLRNIKIALANNIQVRHGSEHQDIDAFYTLHQQTRRRLGAPLQPRRYFDLLGNLLLANELGFISLAYAGSQCVAGAVFLHWQDTLTYKYGASLETGLSLRPNHLIFWDAIQWGCNNGFLKLDFGRSDKDNQGLRVFKSRWGAQESPLNYSILPIRQKEARHESHLMSVLRTLINRSPIWLCQLGGEIFYRYLA